MPAGVGFPAGRDRVKLALTRTERVPNDRANTNGNGDFPSGRASNSAISPGRGRCWGH